MLAKQLTMTLDMTGFMRRMELLNAVILPARIKAGLTVAGKKFMLDTAMEPPSAPIRRPNDYKLPRVPGELRASGALFVDAHKVADTTHLGEGASGKYQPVAYGGTPVNPQYHEACIVFNAPYAATQHELFRRKTEPGAGMLYMQEKLYAHSLEYMRLVAGVIKL